MNFIITRHPIVQVSFISLINSMNFAAVIFVKYPTNVAISDVTLRHSLSPSTHGLASGVRRDHPLRRHH